MGGAASPSGQGCWEGVGPLRAGLGGGGGPCVRGCWGRGETTPTGGSRKEGSGYSLVERRGEGQRGNGSSSVSARTGDAVNEGRVSRFVTVYRELERCRLCDAPRRGSRVELRETGRHRGGGGHVAGGDEGGSGDIVVVGPQGDAPNGRPHVAGVGGPAPRPKAVPVVRPLSTPPG